MATYEVTGPKGEVYHIDGPDDADPSAVIAQVTGRSGPKSFDYDPQTGQMNPTGSPAAKAAQDPSAGGSTLRPFGFNTGIPLSQGVNRFLAGAGKATVDIGRGAGQMVGLESRKNVGDSRALDAPLMATGAGKAGLITGTAVDMLPAAWIPGAATFGGAAAIGGGMGALQPSTSTGETLANIGFGAAAGPLGLAVGRGAGALYQGAKAALAPLFRGGQERIAAQTLQAFAGGPQQAQQAVANISRNGQSVLPGVQPTTAELADNSGVAQLERQLRNNPEAMTGLTERNQSNRAAMTSALDQIAGTPADMQLATRMRSQLTQPLYQSAADATVPADADLGRLLARPSMTRAWERAQQLADEEGISLREPSANEVSGQTLQYLKMALNDMRETAQQRGMGAHEQRALDSTLSSFNRWTMRNVPQLRAADRSFQDLSRPINQMQVGEALRNRLVPALGDFGNNTRLTAGNFANAVRNGDQLAAQTTGLPLGLNDVLNPGQMRTVTQVGEQLARRANADELGRAVGSNTSQNLASQNLLRQFLGPLGLPQGLAERSAQSTLGQTLLKPFQWTASIGEPRILNQLANASLNPQQAIQLLTRATGSRRLAQEMWRRQGLLGPVSDAARLSLMDSTDAP